MGPSRGQIVARLMALNQNPNLEWIIVENLQRKTTKCRGNWKATCFHWLGYDSQRVRLLANHIISLTTFVEKNKQKKTKDVTWEWENLLELEYIFLNSIKGLALHKARRTFFGKEQTYSQLLLIDWCNILLLTSLESGKKHECLLCLTCQYYNKCVLLLDTGVHFS